MTIEKLLNRKDSLLSMMTFIPPQEQHRPEEYCKRCPYSHVRAGRTVICFGGVCQWREFSAGGRRQKGAAQQSARLPR